MRILRKSIVSRVYNFYRCDSSQETNAEVFAWEYSLIQLNQREMSATKTTFAAGRQPRRGRQSRTACCRRARGSWPVVRVPPLPPRIENDSEGIVPRELSEASDGPLFMSQ